MHGMARRDFSALVGDLTASRQAEDRRALASMIERTIAGLNHRHAAEWKAPLVTTRRIDELSAVLKCLHHAFDVPVGLEPEHAEEPQ